MVTLDLLRLLSGQIHQAPSPMQPSLTKPERLLNINDDPGFGTLSVLAAISSPRLVSVDLLDLLKSLDDHSLTLNVLRPFTVDREAQVRQNLLTWVGNIQNRPDLLPETEQRLLTILAQLLEQKFKSLNYKELSKMLQLTPLKEMESVQEVIHEDRIEMLIEQIKVKFKFSERTMEKLTLKLRQLSLKDLEALFRDILYMKTLKQLNTWLDERLPATGEF